MIIKKFVNFLYILMKIFYPNNQHSEGYLYANLEKPWIYPINGDNSSTFLVYNKNQNKNQIKDKIAIYMNEENVKHSINISAFVKLLNTSQLGRNILFSEKVLSTMDYAAEYIGIPGLVVIAMEQTNGRGKNSSKWHSPRGDIYYTVNVKVSTSVKNSLEKISALSVVNSINEIFNQKLPVKYGWPNSINLDNGKEKIKIGGCLIENNGKWSSIGCGIMLNKIKLFIKDYLKEANSYLHKENLHAEIIARSLNNLESLITVNQEFITKKPV